MRNCSAFAAIAAVSASIFFSFAPSSACAAAEEGERYALLVGVGTYRSDSGFNKLKYPESDMGKLKSTLMEIGFDERNIRFMVRTAADERFNPRKENIVKELALLMANKRPQDLVLVVLSGHGLQPRGKDTCYFCPSDAAIKNASSWLDMEAVFAQMKECKAGSKLLISDCCRDDPSLSNLRGAPEDVGSVTRQGKLKPPENTGLLMSCGNGESAYEEEELDGGVFTHFLIEGLKGDAALNGEIEVKTLASFLQRKVGDYVSAKRGASQIPAFKMASDRPLILSNMKAGAAASFPVKMKAAREAYGKKSYKESVALFQAALRFKPDDPSVKTELGAAIYEFARQLHLGEGVEKDLNEARKLYKQAVALNSSRAEYGLGYMYEFGQGVAKDPAEAMQYYKSAADHGLDVAQNRMGLLYLNGNGAPQDFAEAARYFRLGAEQGFSECYTNLGYMYGSGKGVEKNQVEAVRLYRLGAAKAEPYALNNLGQMYRDGIGVEKNPTEALRYFKMAADKGHVPALVELGIIYANGTGVPVNFVEAARYYKMAVDKGSMVAEYNLGWQYLFGKGVAQDVAEAVRLYKLSADKGYSTAQNSLGVFYRDGEGVEQNYQEAVKWFRKAAAQKDAQGQLNLGYMFMQGKGVGQDAAEATRWYKLAADQNEPISQNNLGICYKDGTGVVQSDVEAVKWFTKSATLGYAPAQNWLGVMYMNGRGVGRNPTAGVEWYRKAARQGDEWAIKNLRDLGYGY